MSAAAARSGRCSALNQIRKQSLSDCQWPNSRSFHYLYMLGLFFYKHCTFIRFLTQNQTSDQNQSTIIRRYTSAVFNLSIYMAYNAFLELIPLPFEKLLKYQTIANIKLLIVSIVINCQFNVLSCWLFFEIS